MEAQDITLSREDLLDYANELSREVLGTDAWEAWARVKKGEKAGTLFASKLSQLFFLIEEDSLPLAAE